MKLGICVLTGGKSTRMNKQPKAELLYKGKTFLEIICDEFKDYELKYLSMNTSQKYYVHGYQEIYDEFDSIGPMNGIVSTFHQSNVDALFVCSCDMPFVKKEIVQLLILKLQDYDGVFLKDDKYIYMTMGIYTRKMLPIFEECVKNKDYQLNKILMKMNLKILDYKDLNIDSNILLNVNTQEDYRKINEME